MASLPRDKGAEIALVCGMLQGKPMPALDASHFADARLRAIWKAGQRAVEDGVDPALPILPKYLDTEICSISEAVNLADQFGMEVKDMEIYAKSLRGITARRAALAIAEEAAALAIDTDEPGKPLELMVERSKEALKELDVGNVTTTRSEIIEIIDNLKGVFKQTDLYHELGVRDTKGKARVRKSIQRMCETGLLEPVKNRGAGWYRKLAMDEEVIDFMNAPDTVYDLELPFRLNEMFLARPKNVIVVSGDPDAGKTALLLNIARMNMYKHQVRYFSSESGPNEFRARLMQFAKLKKTDAEYTELKEFTRMIVTERSDDFHDVIRPNDLNIIDYLEIHEDFWGVGGMIKKIFDRLDQGIAIIGLQNKSKEKDSHGLGGLRGLEKPRLSLSLKFNPDEDYHTVKIVKCKSAREPEALNPNGLELDFRLVRGCLFQPIKGIYRAKDGAKRYWKRPSERGKEELTDEHPFY